MATQWYEYDDDAGTKYGYQLDDAQVLMYFSLFGAVPTGYADLASLQAAVPGLLPLPTGLLVRYFTVQSPFFGSAQIVALTQADFVAKEPTGSAPYPMPNFTFADSVAITAATGEQRNGN
jgi:hypothetical protein